MTFWGGIDFLTKFKKEPNSFESFILKYSVVKSDSSEILSSELHNAYALMCSDKDEKPISHISFSKQMINRGFSKHRTSEGVQWEVAITV